MSREAEESARAVSIWEKVFKQAYQRARCKPPCCSERSSQHQPIQLHASHGVPIALIHKCIKLRGRVFSPTRWIYATRPVSRHSSQHGACRAHVAVRRSPSSGENTRPCCDGRPAH